MQVIFSHANLENKNQLVLKLLEEVTKNGNKLSILTDELKSILEDLANLTGPEYHQVRLLNGTQGSATSEFRWSQVSSRGYHYDHGERRVIIYVTCDLDS